MRSCGEETILAADCFGYVDIQKGEKILCAVHGFFNDDSTCSFIDLSST